MTRRERIDDAISLFAAIRDQTKRRENLVAWRKYAAKMLPIRAEWERRSAEMRAARTSRDLRSCMRMWSVVRHRAHSGH